MLPITALAVPAGVAVADSPSAPTYTTERVSPGGFEPRIAVAPDGTRYVSTQDTQGPAGDVLGAGSEVVYASKDGGSSWQRTASDPQVSQPCCDNEIAISPTGRVFSSVIDFSTININIQYSDDGGKTWTSSNGNTAADQDREWLTVGPKDPITGENDVYMLWHNLASGAADHEMMVSTSRDNGATFGPPVPIATPGSQPWLDLQCADSGGPSNIFSNPKTGQVYALFATRSSAAGGCGASATGSFEINIVAATRIWLATSSDQGLTWTDSLVTDDSAPGNIVGMQVNAGTVDDQGNVYVVYPESPQAYPNYDGAAVKYKWAPADLSHWSDAITVAPAVNGGNTPGAGHMLTHIAAGDAGKVALFYLTGDGNGDKALWYPTVSTTYDGLDASPTFNEQRVSDIPSWKGTATNLMGACNVFSGFDKRLAVLDGGTNGFICGRSSDVLGQAIDAGGNPMFTWDDDASAAGGDTAGTYVTQQVGGPSLISSPGPALPESPWMPLVPLAAMVVLAGAAALRWRRHRPSNVA
jgi:hypothetical protein